MLHYVTGLAYSGQFDFIWLTMYRHVTCGQENY